MVFRTTVFTLTASIWLGSAQLALHLLDTEDIHGQMLVYVSLNGITPPASQRP